MIHELARRRNLKIRKVPLWNEKFNKEELVRRYNGMSKRIFDKGYRQRPISDFDKTFPSFMNCIKKGLDPNVAAPEEDRKFISVGVDLSSQKRPGNVIFTTAVKSNNKRVPLDIRIGNWSSPETAKQIAEVDSLYKPHVIVVENNSYQGALIEWIQSLPTDYDFWMKVVPYVTGRQKWSDDTGLPSLESEFNADAWIIALSDTDTHFSDCDCAWCRFISDMINYPQQIGEGDSTMGMWFSREGIRLYMSNGGIQESIHIPENINEFDELFDIIKMDPDDFTNSI
ncbi:MAG: hypothetical protein GF364_03345 [Candidatus Lokiarchaeota archaeon]|nr:hypothetical protein [Candidatus Lokiarchaeota archaeon]